VSDAINEAWSESRINKPKKYPMPLWLTDEEFDKMVESLWIRRNSDDLCKKLWTRMSAIKGCLPD
tara:strand:- start:23257 stop:23451 length:195 start_codon:yes stop_codon:yes gene_type:complete